MHNAGFRTFLALVYLYKRVLVLTYASINPLNIGNGTRQLFSPCSLLRDWYSSAGSGCILQD
ncbi:hypothetical protein GBAR_LOCUS19101, partial [Geodia barretti]